MSRNLQETILEYLSHHPDSTSGKIHAGIGSASYATVKRTLGRLLKAGLVGQEGQAKNTRYRLTSHYEILAPIDVEDYFKKEIDERQIKEQFNFELINTNLPRLDLFSTHETDHLTALQKRFRQNVASLTPTEYDKEMERLAIDLSWKSSQIEGNTYSLLETERLLQEKQTAEGKSQADAIMLLNHKEAITFILEQKDYLNPLSLRCIEDIHSLLIKDLGVQRNIRQGRVGISGTNYRPLDNEHQIREALENMCWLINGKENVFEKALLALLLLSYIQGFSDGNKRTARIVSNAILIAYDDCPLSFRSVDSIEYKKAMLIFYERNNISAFKKIFINQYEFAVNTYF